MMANNTTDVCPSLVNLTCNRGVFLPVWNSTGSSTGDTIARAVVYFSCLLYMFLGVSIIADRFMAAIEVITSKEKEVTITRPTGEVQVIKVRIWNQTVSNLTLMALGSSAPEILLSVIEMIGKGFNAGELGPGTIVGSAAFNLFIIIGVCIMVIPDGQVRRIKHLGVFVITASFSIFAYLWLYIIIGLSSPGEVLLWEALVTLGMFPLTVVCAYIADTKIFFRKFMKKRYSAAKSRPKSYVKHYTPDAESGKGDGHVAITAVEGANGTPGVAFQGIDTNDPEVREFEQHREEYIEVLHELRRSHPNADAETLEQMAQYEILNRGPKSRAFYRMQATRQLTGGGQMITKSKIEKRNAVEEKVSGRGEPHEDPNLQKVFFDPGHYTVMENVGSVRLTVSRFGGNLNASIMVNYLTEDGTATAGDDYELASGTLIFRSGEQHAHLDINILDDEEFEEDEHFYVRLSNLALVGSDGKGAPPGDTFQLGTPSLATVMVLDDDHAGVFHFEAELMRVSEACGFAELKVLRSTGARGMVKLPYKTVEGTAKGGGDDFVDEEGELFFDNNETEKTISIRIIDDEEYEKNELFYVELGEPIWMKKEHRDTKYLPVESEEKGMPRLGEWVKVEVKIVESTEFKNTVDKLLKKANLSLIVGTSSWQEQFHDAITVSPGDAGEEASISCLDYVMHFLTIFWKVIFAAVPPTDYLGGWLCFVASICVIGVMTALIGDLASHFGCTVGLTDAVTAITFVALGTSLPDTFASKVSATNDMYADASIGNVTGSNAVNVFLGLGIAWTIAAFVHYSKGTTLKVEEGSLGFSVTIFCIFGVIAIIVLLIRRKVTGELGGPKKIKLLTGGLFIFLWVLYILLASMENYCHIKGF